MSNRPSLLLADNRRMLGKLLVVALAMFGFGFALVPMYRAICDALGVNVLSVVEQKREDVVTGRRLNTQVDATRDLVWSAVDSCGCYTMSHGIMFRAIAAQGLHDEANLSEVSRMKKALIGFSGFLAVTGGVYACSSDDSSSSSSSSFWYVIPGTVRAALNP